MKSILLIIFTITLLFYSTVARGVEEEIHINTNESCFGFFEEQIPCREDINIESTSPPINITAEGKVGIGGEEEIGVCSWIDKNDTTRLVQCLNLAVKGILQIMQDKIDKAFPKPSPTPVPQTTLYHDLCWNLDALTWEFCKSAFTVDLTPEEPSNLTITWKVIDGFYEIGFRSDGVVVWRKVEN